MQTQKDDGAHRKSDISVGHSRFARKNKAKLGQTAMRLVQGGHDQRPIASHLQHDYLPVIEGK